MKLLLKSFLTALMLSLIFFTFVSFVMKSSAQTSDSDTQEESFPEDSSEPSLEVPDSYNPEVGISVTLSPVFLSLATDPGESVSSQFRVTNNNDFPEYFQISLVKIEANQDGTSPIISDVNPEDEFSNWITYTPSKFMLNPNQGQNIKVTISPPEDASLGYYYGLVVGRLSDTQEQELTEPGTAISASAAISILLNVNSPNAKREIQILDFTTDSLFYEYLPATFNVQVENTGNVHVVPFGNIFIDSMLNDEIAVLSANEGFGNVLPGIKRVFSITWDDGFAVRVPKEENGVILRDDKGNTVYETKFDFSKTDKFRFGRYTANLLMVYDNGERDVPIEATVSFWVIPWKILGVGLIVLILALVGLRSMLLPVWRRIRRR